MDKVDKKMMIDAIDGLGDELKELNLGNFLEKSKDENNPEAQCHCARCYHTLTMKQKRSVKLRRVRKVDGPEPEASIGGNKFDGVPEETWDKLKELLMEKPENEKFSLKPLKLVFDD